MGTQFPPRKEAQQPPPHFSAHVYRDKRLPISATTELSCKLCYILRGRLWRKKASLSYFWLTLVALFDLWAMITYGHVTVLLGGAGCVQQGITDERGFRGGASAGWVRLLHIPWRGHVTSRRPQLLRLFTATSPCRRLRRQVELQVRNVGSI